MATKFYKTSAGRWVVGKYRNVTPHAYVSEMSSNGKIYVYEFGNPHEYLTSGLPTSFCGENGVAYTDLAAFETATDGFFVKAPGDGSSAVGKQFVADAITAADAGTPADTSIMGYVTAAGALLKITWANIKATLKTYFDTIYQTILVSGTSIKTINSVSLLGSGDIASQTAVTYAELTALIAANEGAGSLTPGSQYKLTDFATRHFKTLGNGDQYNSLMDAPAPTGITITPDAVGDNPVTWYYRVFLLYDKLGVTYKSLVSAEIPVIEGDDETELILNFTPKNYGDTINSICIERAEVSGVYNELLYVSYTPPSTLVNPDENELPYDIYPLDSFNSGTTPSYSDAMLMFAAIPTGQVDSGSPATQTGTTETLILTATSPNTLNPIVQSVENPNDIIRYQWTPYLMSAIYDLTFFDASNDDALISGFKGAILTREDTANGNTFNHDFRGGSGFVLPEGTQNLSIAKGINSYVGLDLSGAFGGDIITKSIVINNDLELQAINHGYNTDLGIYVTGYLLSCPEINTDAPPTTNEAGTLAVLTFTTEMSDPSATPEDVIISVGATPVTITGVALGVDTTTWEVTPTVPFANGDVITFSTTKGNFTSATGILLEAITDESVTNIVPA